MKPYSIAVAGSTDYTRQCAEILLRSPQFVIPWILTPAPKLIGGDQQPTPNPFRTWAAQQQLPTIFIDKKIDAEVRENIEKHGRPNFLLVVDFGYLVPAWLLDLPTIAPLNIHPSLLPKWRGSSPGQFSLLYGEKESGVTLMQMDEGLDTGPIIHQEKFPVDHHWRQTDYYAHAFEVISGVLAEQIIQFAKSGKKIAQPSILPLSLARRFKKEDGYIAWEKVAETMGLVSAATTTVGKTNSTAPVEMTSLLADTVRATKQSWPQVIEQASRALFPWPTLWTVIPTTKGAKRMQILHAEVALLNGVEKLQLKRVKIEGQAEASWAQVKNQVL